MGFRLRSILIVDDVRVRREGLAELLHRSGHLRVSATTEASGAIEQMTSENPPDSVVVSGVGAETQLWSVLKAMSEAAPEVNLFVLGAGSGTALIWTQVPADASPTDLVLALERIPSLRSARSRRSGRYGHVAHVPALTRRECEVLDFVEQGLSNGQIAQELTLSISTVKTHVRNFRRKLGLTA